MIKGSSIVWRLLLPAPAAIKKVSRISDYSGTRRLKDVETLADKKDVEAVREEQVEISPHQGTNIQFTSGTTGRPKATLLAHRSLVNNTRQVGDSIVWVLTTFNSWFIDLNSGSHQTGRGRKENLPKRSLLPCIRYGHGHRGSFAFGFHCGTRKSNVQSCKIHRGDFKRKVQRNFWYAYDVGKTAFLNNNFNHNIVNNWWKFFCPFSITAQTNMIDVQNKTGAKIESLITGTIGGAPASPSLFKSIRESLRMDQIKVNAFIELNKRSSFIACLRISKIKSKIYTFHQRLDNPSVCMKILYYFRILWSVKCFKVDFK